MSHISQLVGFKVCCCPLFEGFGLCCIRVRVFRVLQSHRSARVFCAKIGCPSLCCLEIRVVPSIVLVGPFEHQPRLAVLPLCCFGVWVLAVHGSYCSPFSHSRFTMLALRCFMSFMVWVLQFMILVVCL